MNKTLVMIVSLTVLSKAAFATSIIPESTEEVAACESVWAEQFRATPHYEAALEHCEAIRNCKHNSSVNRDELERCMYTAKVEFLKKTNPSEEGGPVYEASSPTVTNPADSQYEDYSDDAKGFMFSEQE